MKCPRCDLKTNRKHWMPEDCIKALQRKLNTKIGPVIENTGPTHNRDMPNLVIPLGEQGYQVAQWCPTDDPKDSKPEQVHVQFHMPNGAPPLVLRLKSLKAATIMTTTIMEHAREVWPEEPVPDADAP